MTAMSANAAAGVLLDTLPVLHAVCAWSLALLLAVAASHKARDLHVFAAILWNYGLLPAVLVKPAAAMLVLVETCTAALLCAAPFSPSASFLGGAAAAGLMLIYGFAIAVNLLRGRTDMNCGCDGAEREQPLHPRLVLRNLFLAVVGGFVVAGAGLGAEWAGNFEPDRSRMAPSEIRPLVWIEWIAALAATLAISSLWAVFGRLRSLSTGPAAGSRG